MNLRDVRAGKRRPRKIFKDSQPGNVARNRAKAANARRKQRLRELGEEE